MTAWCVLQHAAGQEAPVSPEVTRQCGSSGWLEENPGVELVNQPPPGPRTYPLEK